MPCQTVDFHKLSAHLRDYITRFGALQNGIHVPAPKMNLHTAKEEVNSMNYTMVNN